MLIRGWLLFDDNVSRLGAYSRERLIEASRYLTTSMTTDLAFHQLKNLRLWPHPCMIEICDVLIVLFFYISTKCGVASNLKHIGVGCCLLTLSTMANPDIRGGTMPLLAMHAQFVLS